MFSCIHGDDGGCAQCWAEYHESMGGVDWSDMEPVFITKEDFDKTKSENDPFLAMISEKVSAARRKFRQRVRDGIRKAMS